MMELFNNRKKGESIGRSLKNGGQKLPDNWTKKRFG
jgi:hypothetical protein